MATAMTLAERAHDSSQSATAPSKRDEGWRYVTTTALKELELANTTDKSVLALVPAEFAEADLVIANGSIIQSDLPAGFQLADQARSASQALEPLWQDALTLDQLVGWCLQHDTITLQCQGMAKRPLRVVTIHSAGLSGYHLCIEGLPGAAADIEFTHYHDGESRQHAAIGVYAHPGAGLRISELGVGNQPEQQQRLLCKNLAAEKDASIAWATAVSGSLLERHISLGHCLAEGASISLSAATLLHQQQQGHHLVRVRHHAGNSTSRQQFNMIATDQAVGSFDGVIRVDEGADGTDANQHSGNLQLAPKARIAARPQLDIYADDVIASHGATVGQPDADEVAYLISRGINRELATALITEGHLCEALHEMASPRLRSLAETILLGALRGN